MQFKELSNSNLLSNLKLLVTKERELIRQVIEYLEEVEARKLFLEQGYSSMFVFCTEYLNYTPQEAQTRIQAMRLSRSVPEVKTQLQNSEISLSVVAKVQSHIQRENKARKEEKKSLMTVQDKRRVLEAVKGESFRSSEKILFTLFPNHEVVRPEKIKQVAPSTVRLEVNIPKEVFDKLTQLKNLRAAEDFEQIISQLVDLGMNKWDKAREVQPRANSRNKPIGSKPGTSNPIVGAPQLLTSTVKRSIPNRLKRKIWQKDKAKCQYRNFTTGKVCGESFGLHLDHIKPYALGGEHSEENLRLLCARHNLHRAKQTFPENRSYTNKQLD